MLVRLLFASRAVDTSEAAIEAIVAPARAHNVSSGVTGIFCHGNGIFMQVIEGGREVVSTLFAHILRDPRHKDVVLLHYEEITERRFGGWTLGQVPLTKVHAATLLRYFERPELDPYAVSGKVSLALLEELMATAAVCSRA